VLAGGGVGGRKHICLLDPLKHRHEAANSSLPAPPPQQTRAPSQLFDPIGGQNTALIVVAGWLTELRAGWIASGPSQSQRSGKRGAATALASFCNRSQHAAAGQEEHSSNPNTGKYGVLGAGFDLRLQESSSSGGENAKGCEFVIGDGVIWAFLSQGVRRTVYDIGAHHKLHPYAD